MSLGKNFTVQSQYTATIPSPTVEVIKAAMIAANEWGVPDHATVKVDQWASSCSVTFTWVPESTPPKENW